MFVGFDSGCPPALARSKMGVFLSFFLTKKKQKLKLKNPTTSSFLSHRAGAFSRPNDVAVRSFRAQSSAPWLFVKE